MRSATPAACRLGALSAPRQCTPAHTNAMVVLPAARCCIRLRLVLPLPSWLPDSAFPCASQASKRWPCYSCRAALCLWRFTACVCEGAGVEHERAVRQRAALSLMHNRCGSEGDAGRGGEHDRREKDEEGASGLVGGLVGVGVNMWVCWWGSMCVCVCV